MANDYSTLVWIIDTASATNITGDPVRVKGLRWVSEAAVAGQNVVVTDAAGKVVWESVASGGNYVESDHLGDTGRTYAGLRVSTLESGKLYVELA